MTYSLFYRYNGPVRSYTVLQSGVIFYLSPGPCIIVFCVCPKTGLSYLSETFQTLWMCWCECLQKAHAICYHFSKSDGETGAEVIYLSGKMKINFCLACPQGPISHINSCYCYALAFWIRSISCGNVHCGVLIFCVAKKCLCMCSSLRTKILQSRPHISLLKININKYVRTCFSLCLSFPLCVCACVCVCVCVRTLSFKLLFFLLLLIFIPLSVLNVTSVKFNFSLSLSLSLSLSGFFHLPVNL